METRVLLAGVFQCCRPRATWHWAAASRVMLALSCVVMAVAAYPTPSLAQRPSFRFWVSGQDFPDGPYLRHYDMTYELPANDQHYYFDKSINDNRALDIIHYKEEPFGTIYRVPLGIASIDVTTIDYLDGSLIAPPGTAVISDASLSIKGSLLVQGAITIQGDLFVEGDVMCLSDLNIGGNLQVGGQLSIAGWLWGSLLSDDAATSDVDVKLLVCHGCIGNIRQLTCEEIFCYQIIWCDYLKADYAACGSISCHEATVSNLFYVFNGYAKGARLIAPDAVVLIVGSSNFDESDAYYMTKVDLPYLWFWQNRLPLPTENAAVESRGDVANEQEGRG